MSLNIPTAKFVDQTPFELTLEYYDNNDGSIIDKTLQYGFATNEDGLYEVSYSIEAIGLNTSSGISNALDNARTWVLANSGEFSNYASFVNIPSGYRSYNYQKNEQSDKVNGSYKISARWLKAASGFIFEENTNEQIEVDLNGCTISGLNRQFIARGLGSTPLERRTNAATAPEPAWYKYALGSGCSKSSEKAVS